MRVMQLETLRSYFEVSGSFDPQQTLILALILILSTSLVSLVYYYTGNSLSNRGRLAAILPLMSVTTMLIISIIQSSLALSLGLVGALSIVRFRSAIKDPEELAFIFLAIALGLGFGAGQPIITLIFLAVILLLVLGQAVLRQPFSRVFTDRDSLHLEIVFQKPRSLNQVVEEMQPYCQKITLVRLNQDEQQVMMFLIKPQSTDALEKLQQLFQTKYKDARFSLLQYQPLV